MGEHKYYLLNTWKEESYWLLVEGVDLFEMCLVVHKIFPNGSFPQDDLDLDYKHGF